MKNRVVSLRGYGDFDSPFTHSLWLAPHGTDVGYINTLVSEIESEFGKTNDPTKAAQRLRQEGFAPLKNIDCTIGGDL